MPTAEPARRWFERALPHVIERGARRLGRWWPAGPWPLADRERDTERVGDARPWKYWTADDPRPPPVSEG